MDALSEIAVFVRVVEAGSFTAAAERLKLSKSVVSRHVTRLEDRLGARLLNRTTRSRAARPTATAGRFTPAQRHHVSVSGFRERLALHRTRRLTARDRGCGLARGQQ
jgi:DNA-binding transcriptional LysR family regulator